MTHDSRALHATPSWGGGSRGINETRWKGDPGETMVSEAAPFTVFLPSSLPPPPPLYSNVDTKGERGEGAIIRFHFITSWRGRKKEEEKGKEEGEESGERKKKLGSWLDQTQWWATGQWRLQ